MVGGGAIAERRVNTLLEADAKIIVVAPQTTKRIQELADKKRINLVKRDFKISDIKLADLIIITTNDQRLNKKIAMEANQQDKLVNIVDTPTLCDFIIPSSDFTGFSAFGYGSTYKK